ncbi:AzlD domain-containing protein [Pseudomonas tremae]|uniref:AzlD domain-containing protein n=1 Tax=Pseudomonas tremae TaxID=200454 RepID=UPI001F3AFE3E|nr:AzlD domain-containing protein [Pseudomonas tremae]MCF5715497.1 hypothetical protein [Pseudomonas tremae]UQB30162.1 AzlD domain-containing protein [Pseudomonas tremae]
MTDTMLTIFAMGLTVLAVRSVAFVFANHIVLPSAIKNAFELLPPAILTVIVASGVIMQRDGSRLNISLDNAYLLAALATLIIAIRVKNFFAVIVLGYLTYLIIASIVS